MVPMKFSTIFRSRWMALLWSAGIIWFALDVAGDGGEPAGASPAVTTDATGAPVDAEQVKALETIISQ
jgi:hypothetical protein